MHPFVIAALVLGGLAPFVLLMHLSVAGEQTNQTPWAVAASKIETSRTARFHRRHPEDWRAYGNMGYWAHADMMHVRRRGWTAPRIAQARLVYEQAPARRVPKPPRTAP